MRRIAVAVGAVLVLAVGGIAWAAIPNGDGNIYACYNNGDGSVRVKDDPAKACAKGWSPLQWQAQAAQPTTYWERKTVDLPAGEFDEVVVSCHDGDLATGGGFEVATGGPATGKLFATTSIPNPAAGPGAVGHVPTGWWATLTNTDTITRSGTVYVVCLDRTP